MSIKGKYDSYTLYNTLGSGSYGIVFLGKGEKSGSKVAIKIFLHKSKDYDIENNFGELVKISDRCSPYITCLYDYGINNFRKGDIIGSHKVERTGKLFFVVYELMDGDVKDYKFKSIKEFLTFMRETIFGLNALHKAGLAHNDIKPENIFWKKEKGQSIFKLGDLGASCSSDKVEGFKIKCKNYATPEYGAPEVLSRWNKPKSIEAAQRSDVFSLGIVFYKLFMNNFYHYHGREGYPYPEDYHDDFDEIYNWVPIRALKQNDYAVANFKDFTNNSKGNRTKETDVINTIINRMLVVNVNERATSEELTKFFTPKDSNTTENNTKEGRKETKERKVRVSNTKVRGVSKVTKRNSNTKVRREDYNNMSVIQLKGLLRGKGLKVSGRKSELIDRLLSS